MPWSGLRFDGSQYVAVGLPAVVCRNVQDTLRSGVTVKHGQRDSLVHQATDEVAGRMPAAQVVAVNKRERVIDRAQSAQSKITRAIHHKDIDGVGPQCPSENHCLSYPGLAGWNHTGRKSQSAELLDHCILTREHIGPMTSVSKTAGNIS